MARKGPCVIKEGLYDIMEISHLFGMPPVGVDKVCDELGLFSNFDHKFSHTQVEQMAKAIGIPTKSTGVGVEKKIQKSRSSTEMVIFPNLCVYTGELIKASGAKYARLLKNRGPVTKDEFEAIFQKKYGDCFMYEGEMQIPLKFVGDLKLGVGLATLRKDFKEQNFEITRLGRLQCGRLSNIMAVLSMHKIKKSSDDLISAIEEKFVLSNDSVQTTLDTAKSEDREVESLVDNTPAEEEPTSGPLTEEGNPLSHSPSEAGEYYSKEHVDLVIKAAIDCIDSYREGTSKYAQAIAEARFYRAAFILKGGNVDEL